MQHPLLAIPDAFHRGDHLGITSVCSAHPVVIEAALELARDHDRPVLIEATCNQVNQDGGYTGLTPAAFRRFVENIADRVGCDPARIVLGGDHLGPNPWKDRAAEDAMAKAEEMIAAYSEAGFTKLHLDTSMGCKGEPAALSDRQTAERAARLAGVAEASKLDIAPVYVVGTEVPVPGGATHAIDHLELTTAEAVVETHEAHRAAFAARGLTDAFQRVIALVVQPGVEFGHTDVIPFDPSKAKSLSGSLSAYPGLVFEAHSTDYQSAEGLRGLVANGFSILKVGPWLTFALREAIYALDAITDVMDGHPPRGELMAIMEEIMTSDPADWKKYYTGSERDLWLQRHFSYSDRIRYYWPKKKAESAVDALIARMSGRKIPAPLARQFAAPIADGDARDVMREAVKIVLRTYEDACRA